MRHSTLFGRKAAFTIMELLVVIAVLLVLAGITLQSMGGVFSAQRLNNANTNLVAGIQEARNLALANRDSAVGFYRLQFVVPQLGATVTSITYETLDPARAQIANLAPPQVPLTRLDVTVYVNNRTTVCDGPGTAGIEFQRETGVVTLSCSTIPNQAVRQLLIVIRDAARNDERAFVIHAASGVPQTIQCDPADGLPC